VIQQFHSSCYPITDIVDKESAAQALAGHEGEIVQPIARNFSEHKTLVLLIGPQMKTLLKFFNEAHCVLINNLAYNHLV
jgi:hypothetical protein